MNQIRRSAWAFVILGAVAGCSGDEGASSPSNPAPANPSLAPGKSELPPPGQAAAPKEAPSKEMQPAPARTGEAEAKKPDETKKEEAPPKIEGPKTEGTPKGDAAAAKLTPDEIATIKQLPAAEQEIALKQVVCPVSDEHLGEMGKPYKVTVAGRTLFLCCDSCEEKIKADPQKYLAILDARAGKK